MALNTRGKEVAIGYVPIIAEGSQWRKSLAEVVDSFDARIEGRKVGEALDRGIKDGIGPQDRTIKDSLKGGELPAAEEGRKDGNAFKRAFKAQTDGLGASFKTSFTEGFASIKGGFSEASSFLAAGYGAGQLVLPALDALGGAISAATVAAGALVSALTPVAVSAAGPAAGGMLAFASSMGVAKLAFLGMGKAIEDDKALKKLTPEGQAFVRFIRSDMLPRFHELQSVGQKTMFVGVTAGLKRLVREDMPQLRTLVGGTGGALGMLADNASKMFTNGAFKKDLTTIAVANFRSIGKLGAIGLTVSNIIRNLFVGSLPLQSAFFDALRKGVDKIDTLVQKARDDGALSRFFDKARTNASKLWKGFVNVYDALKNVFKLGGSGKDGQKMLDLFDKLTGNFKAWTESAKGKNGIKKYFDDGHQSLRAIGDLLGAIIKMFAGAGKGSTLASLLDGIRLNILPPIQKFIDNANASGGLPKVIESVGKVIGVFADIAGKDSSLKTFADTLSKIADGAKYIFQHVPAASQALGILFAIGGAQAAAKFVGLGGVMDAINGAMLNLGKQGIKGLGKSLPILADGFKDFSLKSYINVSNGFTRMGDAHRKFNDSVTDKLAQAGGKFKDFGSKLGGAIADGIEKAKGPLKSLGGVAKDVAGEIGQGLSGVAGSVGNGLKSAGQKAGDALSSGFDTFRTKAIPAVKNFAVDAGKQIGDFAVSAGGKLKSWAIDGAKAFAGVAKSAALTTLEYGKNIAAIVAQKAIAGAAFAASKLMAAGQWLVNAALSANPIGLVIAAIALLVGAFVLAYNKSTTFRNIVNAAWAAIQAGAKFMWENVLKPLFSDFVAGLQVLWQGAQNAAGFVVNAWNSIRDGASNAFNAVKGFFSDLISNVQQLPGRILSIVGAFADAGRHIGGAIIDGIKNGLTAVGGFVSDIASGMKNALVGTVNSAVDAMNRAIPDSLGPIPLPANPIPHVAFADGGRVWAPWASNNPRADDIPAMLTKGEVVLPVPVVKGLDKRFPGLIDNLLNGLNGFSFGGRVTNVPQVSPVVGAPVPVASPAGGATTARALIDQLVITGGSASEILDELEWRLRSKARSGKYA